MTKGAARRRRIGLVSVALGMLTIASLNALTVGDDFARVGRPLDPWEPWVWELTSAAFWLALLPALRLAAARLLPPALAWPRVVAVHLLAIPLVSALHVGWLAGARATIYRLLGSSYAFDWSRTQLLYEFRKDAVVYLALLALLAGIDRWARAGEPSAPVASDPAPGPAPIAIRDGTRTVWLKPVEIDWIEAAGNYVEVHALGQTLLHRATLSAMEAELPGFVRVHRSRLVRRAAVRSVETTAAGDFTLALESGVRVAGSRRYRAALDAYRSGDEKAGEPQDQVRSRR